ncbi:MAG: GAF domain-containing protein [Cyanobacteria bacterium J06638_20]
MPPALAGSQTDTATYDAVLVLDASKTDGGSDVLTHALAFVGQLNKLIPVIWVVDDPNEKMAIAALSAGVSAYVRQKHLSSLPIVLSRIVQDNRVRQSYLPLEEELPMQQGEPPEHLLYAILQAMHQTIDYRVVMQAAVDELHQTFDLDRCLMFTLEPNGDRHFRIVSAATPDRTHILQQDTVCNIQTPYLRQLQQGEPLICQVENDGTSDLFQQRMQAWQVKTCLILPLICHGMYLGGLVLQTCRTSRQWNANDLKVLSQVSDQCAIALRQAQLFEQTQRCAKEDALLSRVSRILNTTPDLPSALQEVVQLVGEQLGGDRAMLYQARSDVIQIQAEWRRNAGIPSLQNCPITPPNWMEALVSADNGGSPPLPWQSPKTIQPLGASVPKWIETSGMGDVIAVPIFIRSIFYGGLEIYAGSGGRGSNSSSNPSKGHRFTEPEIAFLQRIAEQVAIILHNVEGYENLERIIHERTQHLEAEKQISESANLAKSEFLAHMSHELRTPLTGIIGFSNVLSSQMCDLLTSQQTKYLEGITACGQHLLDMINDLLDLSKVEAGKEELLLEPVVIQEVCDACINMFEEAAFSKKLQLNLAIEPNLSFCLADKRRIKQILSNLLSNAVKFTEVGFVRLTVSEVNNLLRFAVEDSGIGISREDQTYLFQPFQQVQNKTQSIQGTGLGLTLARKLARLHGGDITLTSTLDRGSCFTFWLPHSAPVPAAGQSNLPNTFPILRCSRERDQTGSS